MTANARHAVPPSVEKHTACTEIIYPRNRRLIRKEKCPIPLQIPHQAPPKFSGVEWGVIEAPSSKAFEGERLCPQDAMPSSHVQAPQDTPRGTSGSEFSSQTHLYLPE